MVVAMDGLTGCKAATTDLHDSVAVMDWGYLPLAGDCERLVAADRHPDRAHGKVLLQAVITSIASGVPAALVELRTLGRILPSGPLTC